MSCTQLQLSCVSNVRACLISKQHQASDQLAQMASHPQNLFSKISNSSSLRSFSSGFLQPELTHTSPVTANPAISQCILELTRHLFDAVIARIQPRVYSVSEYRKNQSPNASLHVKRLFHRGSSHPACSFPEERHVVSPFYNKTVNPRFNLKKLKSRFRFSS